MSYALHHLYNYLVKRRLRLSCRVKLKILFSKYIQLHLRRVLLILPANFFSFQNVKDIARARVHSRRAFNRRRLRPREFLGYLSVIRRAKCTFGFNIEFEFTRRDVVTMLIHLRCGWNFFLTMTQRSVTTAQLGFLYCARARACALFRHGFFFLSFV